MIEIMVDLVGIEPTTSSMPWKRAPSCATGPRLKQKSRARRSGRGKVLIIFAHISGIVNALGWKTTHTKDQDDPSRTGSHPDLSS